jgi:hypothetical protein
MEAKDVVSRMLEKEARFRVAASELLKHLWFRNENSKVGSNLLIEAS